MKLDFNSMTTLQKAAYNMRVDLMVTTEWDERLRLDRNSEFFKALEQLVIEESGLDQMSDELFDDPMFIEEDSIETIHSEVLDTVDSNDLTEYITSPVIREMGKTTGRIKQRKLANHFVGYAATHGNSQITRTKAMEVLSNCMPTGRGAMNSEQLSEALTGVTYVGKGDHCHEPSRSANAGHQAVHYHNGEMKVLKKEHFEKLAQALENHAVTSNNRNSRAVKQWQELLNQYHTTGEVEITKKQYSRYTSFISTYFYIGDMMELTEFDKGHPQQALARHERGDARYSAKDVRLLKALIRDGATKQAARKLRYENNTTFCRNLFDNSLV